MFDHSRHRRRSDGGLLLTRGSPGNVALWALQSVGRPPPGYKVPEPGSDGLRSGATRQPTINVLTSAVKEARAETSPLVSSSAVSPCLQIRILHGESLTRHQRAARDFNEMLPRCCVSGGLFF